MQKVCQTMEKSKMIWELSRLISKSIQKLPVKCFFGRKRGGSPLIGDPPGICDIFTKCVHLVSQRITPHFHVSLNHRYIRLSKSWMTQSFEASLPLNITLLPSNQLPIAALKAFPPPLACWRLQHVGSPRRPQLMRHLLMIFFGRPITLKRMGIQITDGSSLLQPKCTENTPLRVPGIFSSWGFISLAFRWKSRQTKIHTSGRTFCFHMTWHTWQIAGASSIRLCLMILYVPPTEKYVLVHT